MGGVQVLVRRERWNGGDETGVIIKDSRLTVKIGDYGEAKG